MFWQHKVYETTLQKEATNNMMSPESNFSFWATLLHTDNFI